MRTARFDYVLPPELIAQTPAAARSDSRLLCVPQRGGAFGEIKFGAIGGLLRRGDVLVANDTRVLPARMDAQKPSGGRVEIMLERILGSHTAMVQLRANKPIRRGQKLLVAQNTPPKSPVELIVLDRCGEFFTLRSETSIAELFTQYGRTPLPPYIKHRANENDDARYQTVYAATAGAVAAPTAGLHFDRGLIARLQTAGVTWVTLTLHIGAGTFQPVRAANAAAHKMHREWFDVSAAAVAKINQAKENGGRVIAVGTTAVRALETAAAAGELKPSSGDTELFILPGYKFRVVDLLLTNFHLPRSTLLMLVCAFGGYANIMRAYKFAVANKFRFYSYGDAMLVARKNSPPR